MQDVLLDVLDIWIQCAAVMARPTLMNVRCASQENVIGSMSKWFTMGNAIVILDVPQSMRQCAEVMARPTLHTVRFATSTALIGLISRWFTMGHVIWRVILRLLDD